MFYSRPLNLNLASVGQLRNLEGIGKARAEAIHRARTRLNRNLTWDDLKSIKEIPSNIWDNLLSKHQVTIENENLELGSGDEYNDKPDLGAGCASYPPPSDESKVPLLSQSAEHLYGDSYFRSQMEQQAALLNKRSEELQDKDTEIKALQDMICKLRTNETNQKPLTTCAISPCTESFIPIENAQGAVYKSPQFELINKLNTVPKFRDNSGPQDTFPGDAKTTYSTLMYPLSSHRVSSNSTGIPNFTPTPKNFSLDNAKLNDRVSLPPPSTPGTLHQRERQHMVTQTWTPIQDHVSPSVQMNRSTPNKWSTPTSLQLFDIASSMPQPSYFPDCHQNIDLQYASPTYPPPNMTPTNFHGNYSVHGPQGGFLPYGAMPDGHVASQYLNAPASGTMGTASNNVSNPSFNNYNAHHYMPSDRYYDRSRGNGRMQPSGPPPAKMATFSGDSDWYAFHMQFEKISGKYQWSLESKLERLVECLRDKALVCYSRAPALTRESYTSLVSCLERRFGRKDPPTTVRRQLQRLRQLDDEALEEFSERALTLAQDGYPEFPDCMIETIALDAFLKGCKEKEAAYTAMHSNPTTLNEAVELVNAAIHNHRVLFGESKRLRYLSTQDSSSDLDVKPSGGHVRSVQPDLPDRVEKL